MFICPICGLESENSDEFVFDGKGGIMCQFCYNAEISIGEDY